MITIKNIQMQTEHVVTPTTFPDNTTQVWKLPDNVLEDGKVKIIWHFEDNGELVSLLQIVDLLRKDGNRQIELIVPFLPYGRQDKKVSNLSTFGLNTIMKILRRVFPDGIQTYDVHSDPTGYVLSGEQFENLSVEEYVKNATTLSGADLICFPDKGASQRGYYTLVPSFHLSKTRDQLTGNITGMVCDLPLNLEGKTILIVDDICDRGGTFIQAAKILRSMGASKVCLYVTHGIFSGGVMFLEGIDHIYTTDSFKTKALPSNKATVFKLEL